MKPSALSATACVALLLGGAAEGASPCAPDDRKCAYAAAIAHPMNRLDAWAGILKLPLEKRIGPAPAALVEHLTLDNIAMGFLQRPRAAELSRDFLADVRAALDELPPSVKRILGKDFGGIYFVEDLGGTGYSNYIRQDTRPVGAYIVLDAGLLARASANEWATWKESTPFVPEATHGLEARIATESRDNRRNAIQYILLHELGHVLSVTARVHPSWTLAPKDVPPSEEFPYFRLSWRIDREKSRYQSIFDATFDQRASVVYYLGPKLRARDMAGVYRQLEATNFPTLYAATHPGDDFAEAFANYVHVVLLKKPFEIQLVEGGRTVKKYGACWQEKRCAEKRRMLETLLASP
jgi:hypothetical protein